jgi:hypothetical protein
VGTPRLAQRLTNAGGVCAIALIWQVLLVLPAHSADVVVEVRCWAAVVAQHPRPIFYILRASSPTLLVLVGMCGVVGVWVDGRLGDPSTLRWKCLLRQLLSVARRLLHSNACVMGGWLLCFWGRYGDTLRYDMGMGSGDPVCDELTKWILDGGGMIDGSRCVSLHAHRACLLPTSRLNLVIPIHQ